MLEDSVTVPSASHLMVSMRVSISLAYGAPKILHKHLESPGVEGQGRGWNDVKPIIGVMDS